MLVVGDAEPAAARCLREALDGVEPSEVLEVVELAGDLGAVVVPSEVAGQADVRHPDSASIGGGDGDEAGREGEDVSGLLGAAVAVWVVGDVVAEFAEPLQDYRCAAGLGLRQGDACGLTVDRVDLLGRQVRIDRQLITPPKGPVRFGPPKTPSSDRVVPLPDTVGEVLAAHLEQFGAGEDGLIFTSRTGAALRRSTWSDVFRSAAEKVGVAASSHDLRHHAASLLIASGCSVKAVQSFLGHKNASETLDSYGHLWPGDEDRLRAAIDAGLRGNVYGMCTGDAAEG